MDDDSYVGNVNSNNGKLNLNESNGHANDNDGVRLSVRQLALLDTFAPAAKHAADFGYFGL